MRNIEDSTIQDVAERDQVQPGRAANHGSAEEELVEETFVLDGRLSNGCALRHPLLVQVWQEGDEFVADSADFNLHAFGGDPEEALQNLRQHLVNHLAFLEEQEDKLVPRLARDRERLRELFVTPCA